MLRKLCFTIALAVVGVSGSNLSAQTEQTSKPISANPKVEMATYGRDYATSSTPASLASCQNCSPGGGAGYGYATGGPSVNAYGRIWGGAQSNRDCARFYHYPYVYYPQNFQGNEYFRSSNSLYHRYPPEMQIPVYNRHWHNYYPSNRRYHWGHHFILDVF